MSGPGARARDWVRCLVSCMGVIGLELELESGSDVRAIARLSISVMVRYA